MATKTVTPSDTRPPSKNKLEIRDDLLQAQAILDCFLKAVPDERADDRYVLRAVRDIMDQAGDELELLRAEDL